VTAEVVLPDRLANRRREIHVLNAEVARARIVLARRVTRRWQFDNEICSRTVTACGFGVTERTSGPESPSVVNVSIVSTSVFFGKFFVLGR
jgi:hypothetical protein